MKFVTLKLFCPDHHQIAVILIFPEPEMRDRRINPTMNCNNGPRGLFRLQL